MPARLLPPELAFALLWEGIGTACGYAGGVCTDPSPGRTEVGPLRPASDAQSFAFIDPGTHGGLAVTVAEWLS